MAITIRYFAVFREALGTDSEPVALSALEEPTIAGVWHYVVGKAPKFDGKVSFVRFALNQEFVDITHTVQDGDEVALIPPVSGG